MLEHLVVQDIFLTETATYADVIFPASAWPEKNGTVTNTNRQVQMGRKALDSPGEAKEDWWITNELGKRMGLTWTYKHPKEIYEEMSLTMPSLNNISWERLKNENSVTYPSKSPTTPGDEIVFGDKFPLGVYISNLNPFFFQVRLLSTNLLWPDLELSLIHI